MRIYSIKPGATPHHLPPTPPKPLPFHHTHSTNPRTPPHLHPAGYIRQNPKSLYFRKDLPVLAEVNKRRKNYKCRNFWDLVVFSNKSVCRHKKVPVDRTKKKCLSTVYYITLVKISKVQKSVRRFRKVFVDVKKSACRHKKSDCRLDQKKCLSTVYYITLRKISTIWYICAKAISYWNLKKKWAIT